MSDGRPDRSDDSDLGGEAPCYAHLFEDADDADETADGAPERRSGG
jgi:hypothetical protein